MLYYFKTCERSMSYIDAPVAQLDRVTDSDSVGHWFESSRAYQCEKTHSSIRVRLFLFLKFLKVCDKKAVIWRGEQPMLFRIFLR